MKKRRKPEVPLKRPHVQVLLERAEDWQRMLDAGEVRSRADLARRFGVSGPRVSNILNLLRLAPEIQQAIRELPLGTPRSVMSERGLRELARTPVAVRDERIALHDAETEEGLARAWERKMLAGGRRRNYE